DRAVKADSDAAEQAAASPGAPARAPGDLAGADQRGGDRLAGPAGPRPPVDRDGDRRPGAHGAPPAEKRSGANAASDRLVGRPVTCSAMSNPVAADRPMPAPSCPQA